MPRASRFPSLYSWRGPVFLVGNHFVCLCAEEPLTELLAKGDPAGPGGGRARLGETTEFSEMNR